VTHGIFDLTDIFDLIDQNQRIHDRSHQEWEKIIPQLNDQGVAGMVYQSKKHLLPESVQQSLKNSFFAQSIYNSILQDELKKIKTTFQAKNIHGTLLKGMSLIDQIYDIGERPMADIDLLLPIEKFKMASKELESLGYTLLTEKRWKANFFKKNFVKYTTGDLKIEVELHSKLFFSEPKEFTWIQEDSENFGFLKTEDNLIHLMGHLGFQHTFHKLFWLVDIDRLIRKHANALDWEYVLKKLALLNQTRSSAAVLGACYRYLQTPVPQQILSDLPAFPKWVWKTLLTKSFFSAPQKNILNYFIIKHLMKDSLVEAFKYDFFWILSRLI
jgi:hypothetical protein